MRLPASTIGSGSMNSVCAAGRLVVHDALDLAALVGLDGQDVAAVALGDDGVLQRRPHRVEQRLKLAHHPVAGDPQIAPDLMELRAGVVADLAAGLDGVVDLLLDAQEVGEAGGDVRQHRHRVAQPQDGAAPEPGHPGGGSHVEQLERLEDAAEVGPLGDLADVVGAAEGEPGLERGRRRASSVVACQRSTRNASGDGSRASASSRPAENEVRLGQHLADLLELERPERRTARGALAVSGSRSRGTSRASPDAVLTPLPAHAGGGDGGLTRFRSRRVARRIIAPARTDSGPRAR